MTRPPLAILSGALLLPFAAFADGQVADNPPATTTSSAELAPGSGEFDTSRSEAREAIVRYAQDNRALGRSISNLPSLGRRKRLERFSKEWLLTLDHLPFDKMSRDGRIDFLLLRNEIEHQLRQLDIQEKRAGEIAALVPFNEAIVALEEARRRSEPIDPEKVAGQLAELSKRVDQVRKDLEGPPRRGRSEADASPSKGDESPGDRIAEKPPGGKPAIAKSLALRAASSAEEHRQALATWFAFYNGYDPLFTWWAAQPYKDVDQALRKQVSTLREKVAGIKADEEANREGREIVGDPIGREALLADLAFEMIPYSPEELVAIAEDELAWCEGEMKRASRDLGFGDDWKKALEFVKTKHVDPGKQPALIRELAQDAIDFLDKRDLVTIPPLARETWGIEMMSPRQQLVNPFFVYGGGDVVVSFPTDAMTHEQKQMSLRGNNIHFAHATVHHELIPGHHLQQFMSSRHRAYRAPFRTPFAVEGWALYWELRLWDLDFARSAEDRVGMLFWRMHRCARIIFSLGFHLGNLTPEQCVNLLVDRIGHERANASGEVRRSFDGNYGPLYQAAYLLGGMQLRALHRELVVPGKMTERAFHDAILRENAIPAAMVRASLSGIELDRDGKAASWKFSGPEPLKK